MLPTSYICTAKDGSQQGQQERQELAEQLFVNLLTLLLQHKNDPEAVGAYFDQDLLRRRAPLPEAAAI
ncbi:hypothetical protein [Hymenobacter weizhouensis]|uniref:hypothetical protein n=1 Tax=Hymenobacter sp. YIM 151500-1 TaxID=2987689 RepID=UPI0022275A00|nr:hypothetical protein [Hymenobacter sp. YIM 151500-1]UYZ61417.1 hypothetical protein OIS53_10395 [Hymenobacter sp. YIM 151500-1]